jgi:L-threonylcarbamoyladenylate synthase
MPHAHDFATPTFDAAVDAAVSALRAGKVVGLPTETVYGLAADARNDGAVRKVFALKGRPADHPLIVHLADAQALADWALEPSADALTLAARFWPGPLTLIVRRAPGVSDLITGGQDTVGVRVPAHPLAQSVLRAFGGALAAPSANRFGHVSPTTAAHVRAEFGAAVPLVLDGGPCEVGIESTIVDVSVQPPRILRPGAIGAEAIAQALGHALGAADNAASAPRVSGSLRSHYAPRASAELVERVQLVARAHRARDDDEAVLCLALGRLPDGVAGLGMPVDATNYARHLYAALRQLDAEGADRILIERPPEGAEWQAIHDRLRRATAGQFEEEA